MRPSTVPAGSEGAVRRRAHHAPGLQAPDSYFTSPAAVIVSRLMSQPCPTATICFSSLVWSYTTRHFPTRHHWVDGFVAHPADTNAMSSVKNNSTRRGFIRPPNLNARPLWPQCEVSRDYPRVDE